MFCKTPFAKNGTSRDSTDKETATNKLSFSSGDGNVLRAMMQALGDSGCVVHFFLFQRSPEMLRVSLTAWRYLARDVTECLFEM